MKLARKSRVHVFLGLERTNPKNWNDATQSAMKSLVSDHQQTVKNYENPLIKSSVTIPPEEQISILLDSADNGAKIIVS